MSYRVIQWSTGNVGTYALRHVIDQYKHREQTITCVCGWHGSCATNSTGGSDWTTHLNQFRTKRK